MSRDAHFSSAGSATPTQVGNIVAWMYYHLLLFSANDKYRVSSNTYIQLTWGLPQSASFQRYPIEISWVAHDVHVHTSASNEHVDRTSTGLVRFPWQSLVLISRGWFGWKQVTTHSTQYLYQSVMRGEDDRCIKSLVYGHEKLIRSCNWLARIGSMVARSCMTETGLSWVSRFSSI